jgi:hypothetical protein
MTVHRALDVKRPAHLEVAPFVIERAHLGRIAVVAGVLVLEDGPLIPRIPQAWHDIEDLTGNLIALTVLVVKGMELDADGCAVRMLKFTREPDAIEAARAKMLEFGNAPTGAYYPTGAERADNIARASMER